MVDLFGVLGNRDYTVDGMGDELVGRGAGQSSSFAEEQIAVEVRFHSLLAEDQPAQAVSGDVLAWVLGEIYGYEWPTGYEMRPAGVDSVEYVASLYENHESDATFAEGLNGEFAALIYDRTADRALLVTDPVGSRPVFIAHPTVGTLVFSTAIQRLPTYPAVETEFDREYLLEYLAFKRSFGLKTPLSGIEKLPPATVTSIDLTSGATRQKRYWKPTYQPIDKSFKWFAQRFATTLKKVLNEWCAADREYGLLLSGGSDSRAVLAGIDGEARALHLCDWENREARRTREVAAAADCEFVPLARSRDHERRAFEQTGPLAGFTGWFSHAHAAGLEDRLRAEADVLLTGLYADTLFKGYSLPMAGLSLGPVGNVNLPVARLPSSIETYVERLAEQGTPPFDPARLRETLAGNIRQTPEGVVHHGVRYNSLADIIVTGGYCPLTNDGDVLFLDTLREAVPTRTPYLDRRLLDLHLRLPLAYRIRRNLVNRGIEHLDPELAAVPHAETGVAPTYAFPIEYLARHLNDFRWKYFPPEMPPEPHLSHCSWADSAEFIRQSTFVGDVLRDQEALIDALPGIDHSDAQNWYRRHLNGENLTGALYGLLTVLSMPVTDHVCRQQTVSPRDTA